MKLVALVLLIFATTSSFANDGERIVELSESKVGSLTYHLLFAVKWTARDTHASLSTILNRERTNSSSVEHLCYSIEPAMRLALKIRKDFELFRASYELVNPFRVEYFNDDTLDHVASFIVDSDLQSKQVIYMCAEIEANKNHLFNHAQFMNVLESLTETIRVTAAELN